ncbi:MAG: hypothetical protein Q9220_002619 [cf. Caloplaca sp. 1 TL-2023]
MNDPSDAGIDADFAVRPPVPASNGLQSQIKMNPSNTSLPSTTTAESGLSKRPRDSRLVHMILANLGVSGYQERVPLQLMDFAYRYTSSTLQDALHLTSEGYGTQSSATVKAASSNDMSAITLSSLRLSIASRTHYQFSPTLHKDFYHEIAHDRNQVQLPAVGRDWGMRLPPEQYCLTGIGWKLKNGLEIGSKDGEMPDSDLDQTMVDREEDQDEDGAEDGNERMEDFFGKNVNGDQNDQEMDD